MNLSDDLAALLSGVYTQWKENQHVKEIVCCSTVHSNQDRISTEVPLNGRKDEENVVFI